MKNFTEILNEKKITSTGQQWIIEKIKPHATVGQIVELGVKGGGYGHCSIPSLDVPQVIKLLQDALKGKAKLG